MTSIARFFLLFLLIFGSLSSVNAQKNKAFEVKDLEVKWQMIANNFENSGRCQSAFVLYNRGKVPFPATGWTIHFTSNQAIWNAAATEGAKIEHVNGDNFIFQPTAQFKAIPAGDSVWVVYFTDANLINITACPTGLYLVWSAQPDKGLAINRYSVALLKNTAPGQATPEKIYQKNSLIQELSTAQLPKIFPSPAQYQETGGEMTLTSAYSIQFDPLLEKEAQYLMAELSRKLIPNNGPKTTKITFQKNTALGAEAYQLSVKKDEILVAASSGAGAFYGIQSLWSMMPPEVWSAAQAAIVLPTLEVQDAPRFGYRSFMLDVARNFKSKKDILRVLDLMALYKMNVFHFHFSEDEGWRIEIPGLPELTNIGAKRGHTVDSKNWLPASYAAGPEPGKSLGTGYLTRAEFIEILKYAHARHIQVIPEIESPGHSRAAIKAMEVRYETLMKSGQAEEAEKYRLADPDDKSKYSSAQLWSDNVMCVARPSVYTFLEKVVDELVLMYREAGAPLSTIHMGGDEVPAGVWEQSPICQKLIADDPNLHSADDFWNYYYGRVSKMLQSKGIFLSAWEEAGMHKTKLDGEKKLIVNPLFANDHFQLHVWNNVPGWGAEDLPYQLANSGYKVVLSPVSNNYLDLAYSKHPDEPGLYWGGFQDLDKPFYFIPFDYYRNTVENPAGSPIDPSVFDCKERLTDYGKSNIVGIQGLLWGENLTKVETMEYMLLPKILGVAERAWAQEPDWAMEKDKAKFEQKYRAAWSQFVHVVGKRELPRLDYFSGGYNYRIPWPGAMLENGAVRANMQLPGFTLRYTTDGTEPTLSSRVYQGPIFEKGTLKIKAFNAKGRSSLTTVLEHK